MSYVKKYTFAPLPQTNRGEGIKLGSDPKGKTFLYTNGKSVFIRDIENPSLATEYIGHSTRTTVARYSPSGFYIASGDISGSVRIWDTVNEEHLLKNEIKPISGKISDIAWDSESKRIIAVGEGKERFGHAFSFDTLSSTGEIGGHSKVINSVSIRQQRPFRAVTASDDLTVTFYTGVPFKYSKTIKAHTRFVHAVQFSPDGSHFVSAGADGKIFLYEGQNGDLVHEFTEQDSHTGGIFSVSWSPDSKQLISSSADSTVKLWDISSNKVVSTFDINSAFNPVDNQQVGNLWQNDWLLSTSLSGEINYLDKSSGKVSRTVDGHSKAITALSVSKEDTLFTGSYDGRVYSWDYGTEGGSTLAAPFSGQGHTNQVTSLAVKDSTLLSVGMDDIIKASSTESKTFSDKTISTGALPGSIAVSNDKTIVVTTSESIQIYNGDLKKINQKDNLDYSPTVAAIDASGEYLIVGGKDNKARVYELSNLELVKELANNLGDISALAAHPTLPLIAVGDSVGKIFAYDLETGKPVIQSWVFHTARITALDWSSCGVFLVSGGLDTNIYVWNLEKPFKKVAIKNSHIDAVNSVRFLHNSEELGVASVGQDAALRLWQVKKPE